MSDSPFYILDPRRLASSTKAHQWLGRIVQDYKNPTGSYTPEDPQQVTSDYIKETVIKELEAATGACQDTSLMVGLTSLASFASGRGNGNAFSFKTSTMRCLRLENYPKVFKAIRQLPEVEADIQQYLKPGGKPAYLIVGLLTWTDPTFVEAQRFSKSHSVDGQLPVAAIVTAATAGVPLPVDVGDPTAGRSVREASQRRMKGTMAGSYIFAVEYKAVRRKAYSLMKPFTPILESHGPRKEGDRVLGGEAKPEAALSDVVEPTAMDVDEDVIWTDTLGVKAPQEADFAGLVLAYDSVPEH